MVSYNSNYEATNYDTEIDARPTSDVAYSRNSIISHVTYIILQTCSVTNWRWSRIT